MINLLGPSQLVAPKEIKMYLDKTVRGMKVSELNELGVLYEDCFIDYTRDGKEKILIAYDGQQDWRLDHTIYFIVEDVETHRISQFWIFPAGYSGLHPFQFDR